MQEFEYSIPLFYVFFCCSIPLFYMFLLMLFHYFTCFWRFYSTILHVLTILFHYLTQLSDKVAHAASLRLCFYRPFLPFREYKSAEKYARCMQGGLIKL